jgi:mono/diheme cytochrome c family protein
MSAHNSTLYRLGLFLLGIACTFILLIVGGYLYLHFGNPPVAADDPAFPYEAQIVHVPLAARVRREMEKPPFPASEDAFVRGAEVYRKDCAFCHGTPGGDSVYGASMYPAAPQLWHKHKKGNVVGVSDDEVGETYWKVKNGIRLTGMPTYQNLLSDSDVWDVSLLLKNADQQLPDPVMKLLNGQ